jgi:alcohol dehydrogenase class IV
MQQLLFFYQNSIKNDVQSLRDRFRTKKDCGISEDKFMQAVDNLADKAFEDQCTTANPGMPLVSELRDLYIKAYKGE